MDDKLDNSNTAAADIVINQGVQHIKSCLFFIICFNKCSKIC